MDKYYITNSDFSKFKNSPGVYAMFCSSDDHGKKPKPIPRLLKTDKTGLLYIGRTTDLTRRMRQLARSISSTTYAKNHVCGKRYRSNKKIMKRIPEKRLFVIITKGKSPETLEKKKLSKYFDEFGEMPPLNRQG